MSLLPTQELPSGDGDTFGPFTILDAKGARVPIASARLTVRPFIGGPPAFQSNGDPIDAYTFTFDVPGGAITVDRDTVFLAAITGLDTDGVPHTLAFQLKVTAHA